METTGAAGHELVQRREKAVVVNQQDFGRFAAVLQPDLLAGISALGLPDCRVGPNKHGAVVKINAQIARARDKSWRCAGLALCPSK